MNNKRRTVEAMKEKREVSAEVRAGVRDFNKLKKLIIGAIKTEPKTIPQIAEETGLSTEKVVFHLMTLLKYGDIEVDSLDDMDEYYFYRVTGERNDENRS